MNRDSICSHPRCDGVSRRDFLQLGVSTVLGLSLADVLRWKALAAEGAGAGARGRAASCIFIWLDGGPSHLDTFDPKPEAPSEVRSQFGTIPTAVPGLRICEHLPLTALVMDRVALIRSLTHELGNHDTGTRYLFTGHRPAPSLDRPSLGSLTAHAAGFGAAMPPYVAVPGDAVGGDSGAAGSGFLPRAYSAFSVGQNGGPAEMGRVPDLDPPEGVSFERGERRRDMLRKMDAFSRRVEDGPATRSRDAFYEEAYRLLASTKAKAAFDISKESPSTRERYGSGRLGAGCLLARRLIEAGARFVTVVDTGWDIHQQIFRELPDSRFPGSGKLPQLDRAYSALIDDLRERGLLSTTLVALLGEFGRTPKINALAGRDHWPRAGFACLAGGGVQGGRVVGATDARGEAPADRPVTPPDLAFTILDLLGIDPGRELVTPAGRPVRILSEGSLIAEVL
jgi:uncharacterized protein DUF1501